LSIMGVSCKGCTRLLHFILLIEIAFTLCDTYDRYTKAEESIDPDDYRCWPDHGEKFWGYCRTKKGNWIHVMGTDHPLLKALDLHYAEGGEPLRFSDFIYNRSYVNA
jgi:hypothetical protein